MVDSVQVFDPGFRVTDANGNPVNAAKIKFRVVGGGAPKEVFSDKDLSASLGAIVRTRADGYPVVSFGSDTTVLVYTNITPYHIEITDTNDVPIFPAKDNVRGALDTSGFLTAASPSTLSIKVVHQAVNKTLSTADNGKVFNATDAITFTLDAAATLGDGWNVRVRNGCSSGDLVVKLVAAQNIDLPPKPTTAIVLRKGEGYTISCNGSKFTAWGYTPPYFAGLLGVITIADIITALPGGPAPGVRYMIGASFDIYTVSQVIEADGQGGWIIADLTSDAGAIAWVQDENRYYRFQDNNFFLGLEPDASDTVKGLIELADQTEMEAGSDLAKAVVPGRQQFHNSACKVHGSFNFAGTILNSYNITSITDVGAGRVGVTIATDFSGASWTAVLGAEDNGGTAFFPSYFTKTAGSLEVRTWSSFAILADAGKVDMAGFGDQ
jgi:CBS domain-containing protein